MHSNIKDELDWARVDSSEDYDAEDESEHSDNDGRLFKATDYYFTQLTRGNSGDKIASARS